MTWSVRPTTVEGLPRRSDRLVYDFVECAARDGCGFLLEDGGYFIVAGQKTLLPRFIVEVKLPQMGAPEEYASLAYVMAERSCGFMWFDSTDVDAHDMAWRLRLPLRAGPPLLSWNDGCRPPGLGRGMKVVTPPRKANGQIISLLTSVPAEHGGQSREAAREHIRRRAVRVLQRGPTVLGVAVVAPFGDDVALASLLVMAEEHRGKGLGTAFMGEIGEEFASRGRMVVFSMSRENVASFRGALHLGMTVARCSWTAQFPNLF